MTESPLYQLSWATVALHFMGAALSLWLIGQTAGDWWWLRSLGVGGSDRRAIARHALVAEVERLAAQVLLISTRLPGLFIATDRYSAILSDLWLLLLFSTIGHALIAVLLFHTSLDHALLRRQILSNRRRVENQSEFDRNRES